jgi:hypothetical protein
VQKHRKLLLAVTLMALLLIVVIALCFAPSRRVITEPQYQGRYLSEWLSDPQLLIPDLEFADETGLTAVRAIGTNALPFYLAWLHYEPGELRKTVWSSPIHRQAANTPAYSNWLNPSEQWRATYAFRGFEILNTNAVSAIPELAAMLNLTNRPYTSARALAVLQVIGPSAIPVLNAALAQTNRPDRARIAGTLRYMGNRGYSNLCLPILRDALSDPDAEVRAEAGKALEQWSPQLLTNSLSN